MPEVSRGLALAIVGFTLLGVAWMFSTPLLDAPDEASHYLRALTLAEGHLIGPRPVLGPFKGRSAADERLRWVARDLRQVSVPAALSPSDETCLNGRPDVSGHCTEESYTGDYFPLPYVLPAVAISASHDWQTAMWLSRAASLLPVLLFIALALIVARPGARWGTVGLLAAITPTVLFVGSVLNPSGLELAANLAFVTALLRLRRDGPELPAWYWVALVASGAVTVLAWQLGPVFALWDIAAWAALTGIDGLRDLASRRPAPLLATGSLLAAATIASVVWGVASGVLHSTVSFAPGLSGFGVGAAQFTPTLKGAVGTFGLYNVFLPSVVVDLWWLGVIVLIAGGLWRGRGRDRIVLALVTAAGLAFPIVFFVYAYQSSGFGLQARYVLPALTLIPMIAGDVIDHGAGRDRAGRVSSAASGRAAQVSMAGLAVAQLFAWWWNAHRWSGTNALVVHPGLWSPPGGWAPWLAAAALGGIALLGSAASPLSAPGVVRRPGDL